MNPAKFTVTRQKRWEDGVRVVEISQGGDDYSNADALVAEYDGEFETFDGMTPAVKKGIEIAQQWQKDQPDEKIYIGAGFTHGFTMHFDELELTEENLAALLKEAEEFDEKLPKCDRCGDFLPRERDRVALLPPYDFDEEFCSENCANNAYYDYLKQDEEELEEEDDEEE